MTVQPDDAPDLSAIGEAACRYVDPEVFFPKGYAPDARRQVLQAKAVCVHCAVRRECLQLALTNREESGIWGGRTPAERSRLRRRG